MSTAPTPERILAAGAVAALGDSLSRHGFGRKLMLVCDDATWVAAGQGIHIRHGTDLDLTAHSLGRYVRPVIDHTNKLVEVAADCDGLIAVGSGTVNDVTKLAAARLGKPYVCVATAASMNGYTSASASLEEQGMKRSFPAPPPKAIIADIDVIAGAPKKLARSGLGDTLCRSSVETDMLMSHLLLDTPYPRETFDILRSHEQGLIAGANTLRESDRAYLMKLMLALLDAGDAMAAHGTSAPASQGEHMIAHTVEMMYGLELRQVLHGELIAITTVTMNHLQQKMLLGTPRVKTLAREEGQLQRAFGKTSGNYLAPLYARKVLDAAMVEQVNARLNNNWPEIKSGLLGIMASPSIIERAFIQASVAIKPTDIAITDERYRFACNSAYLTRDRFTFLDLAAMNDKRIA